MRMALREALHRLPEMQDLTVRQLRNAPGIIARLLAREVSRSLLKDLFRSSRAVGYNLASVAVSQFAGRTAQRGFLPIASMGIGSILGGVFFDFLLFPSEVGDGTVSGAYTRNPLGLLEGQSAEEGCRWLKQYSSVRGSVAALAEALALEAEDAPVLACESPLPEKNSSEAPAVTGQVRTAAAAL